MCLGYREPITLASIYIPHGKNFKCNELRDVVRQLPKPVILIGVFIAHHEMWGNDQTDQRGKVMEELIIQEELNILNNGAVTHIMNSDCPQYSVTRTGDGYAVLCDSNSIVK